MPERSSKNRRDVNVIATSIVDAVAGEKQPEEPSDKNPAAVALGRLGGLRGGKARAEKLSKKKRKEIARKGAAARWAKARKPSLS